MMSEDAGRFGRGEGMKLAGKLGNSMKMRLAYWLRKRGKAKYIRDRIKAFV
jgi:hypothetical protein